MAGAWWLWCMRSSSINVSPLVPCLSQGRWPSGEGGGGSRAHILLTLGHGPVPPGYQFHARLTGNSSHDRHLLGVLDVLTVLVIVTHLRCMLMHPGPVKGSASWSPEDLQRTALVSRHGEVRMVAKGARQSPPSPHLHTHHSIVA